MDEMYRLATPENAILDILYIDETAELVSTGIGGMKVHFNCVIFV